MALREARARGVKGRSFEGAEPLLGDSAVAQLAVAAQICEGLVKGLKHPDWPVGPRDGLKRRVPMLVQATAAAGQARGPRRVPMA